MTLALQRQKPTVTHLGVNPSLNMVNLEGTGRAPLGKGVRKQSCLEEQGPSDGQGEVHICRMRASNEGLGLWSMNRTKKPAG